MSDRAAEERRDLADIKKREEEDKQEIMDARALTRDMEAIFQLELLADVLMFIEQEPNGTVQGEVLT